ncbi:hypothetical protein EW026_g3304 [Hermanssonia centrifuga]|uniref:Replication protein A C-terminal domain-containing protein n=1 Tax=Hermanssonia centrifuga TaxID=98765 RepID=A0A4S4KL49_9APHY|nr:hypothetical protein EW026_g3304 [Hermanssonia centrifuga]
MSQYNDNPYYSNTGAGGGYLASPVGSTGGSPGGAPRRTGASHSLRPVTIKQLIGATQAHADAEWHIDDMEVGQVTVVAVAVSINAQTTNSVYWLDDGTGRIEARHWVDMSSGEGDSEKFGIKENTYIRVMGSLKSFGNKRYINATHLRPVEDRHEIFFHGLDCMTATLTLEKGPPPRPGQPQTAAAAARTPGTSAYTAQSHGASANDQFSHLPAIQRNIVNFILAQPMDVRDNGVHVAAIARAIGGDAQSISGALDKLMDEGHVYTTIDESHFNVSA